jgi:transcriptional regulator with XRE-family HTH domain/tetratricopeptide (TPR) repeat protein
VLGDIVRAERLRLGITQEELAHSSGVSVRSIRAIETGSAPRPQLRTVRLLAAVLARSEADRARFQEAALRYAVESPAPADPPPGRVMVPVPRQLPRRLVDLVGRAPETRWLRGVLGPAGVRRPGAPPVAAVYGPGGVGKTALAVHVAWALAPVYPDGCLFADLGGDEIGPLRLLSSFLRALGMPAGAVPHELPDRVAAYRTMLADRRVLVVLDNAASADQVRPLLPAGAGCGALVTSRRRLVSVDGTEAIALAPLGQAEAVRLLLLLAGPRHAGTDPALLDALADQCGRMPIALRVAGARLAAREDLSAGALVGRLGDEHRRLDELAIDDLEVRATLAVSYRRLDPAAQVALRRLGLAPSPEVDSRLAATMFDLPAPAAEILLTRLVDEQLVQARAGEFDGTSRYRMHDLVRLFARELAERDDGDGLRRSVLDRANAHLLGLAVTADAHLAAREFPRSLGDAPPPPGSELAIAVAADPIGWFDQERSTLVGFVAAAAQHGQAAAAWRLTAAMVNYLEQQVRIDDWVYVLDKSLAATEVADQSLGRAAMLHAKAFLLRGFGENGEAYELLREARRRYRVGGDELGAAVAAMHQGMCARAMGQRRIAFAALHTALTAFARLGDPPQTGYAQVCLGNLMLGTGDLSGARAEYKSAVIRFEANGDRRGEANALACLTKVHLGAGAVEEALTCCHRSIELFTEIGDAANVAEAEIILADLHLSVDDVAAARVVAARAYASCQQLGYRSGESRSRRSLALALLGMGEAATAQGLLGESAIEFRARGQPYQLGLTLFGLARAEHALGVAAATGSAREARELLAAAGSPVRAEVDEWLGAVS